MKGRKRQTTDVKVKKAVTCIINFITLIEKKEKVAVLKYKAAEKMKYEKAAQLRTKELDYDKKIDLMMSRLRKYKRMLK